MNRFAIVAVLVVLLAPAVLAAAPTCSKSSCAKLKWTNAAKFGNKAVCSSRNRGTKTGKCSGAVNFATAKAHCEHKGARLCSYAEVHADEARGSGCGYDAKRVWSSTSCGTGKVWTQAGRRNEVRKARKFCTSVTAKVYNQCCATTVACKRALSKCAAGKYGVKDAAGAQCKSCPAGRSAPAKATACGACLRGKYQSQAGQGSCIACAAGFETKKAGAAASMDCVSKPVVVDVGRQCSDGFVAAE